MNQQVVQAFHKDRGSKFVMKFIHFDLSERVKTLFITIQIIFDLQRYNNLVVLRLMVETFFDTFRPAIY